MWNYIWLLFLLSVTNADESKIFLPSQVRVDGGRSVCSSPNPNLNYKPVIGILSHPGDGASGRLLNSSDASYIAASYVKFAETGGARVIPLLFNEDEETIFKKLELVNGVIFPGGWANRGLYFDTVSKIFKKILERNDAGEHVPVYAINLGFEILTMIISQDRNIIEKFNSVSSASSLQFVENVALQGTVFQKFPQDLLTKLETDCLVTQTHRYGISPRKFKANDALSKFFNIVTTSVDEHNQDYVSTVQALLYPVTGFQWHPEKNAFEWGSSKIPHSEEAIEVTQKAANYLVSEARKSSNRPGSKEVLKNLIYNHKPTYCGYNGKGYDEVYIFTNN